MKIAILSDSFPPESTGGADQMAYNFARACARAGHEILIVTTTKNLNDVGRESLESMQIERIYSHYHPRWRSWKSVYNRATVPKVREILRVYKPDVVHAHNVHQDLSYATFGVVRSLGIPLLHTIHDAVPLSPYKIVPRMSECTDVCIEPQYDTSWLSELRQSRLRFNPFRRFFIRRALQKCSKLLVVSRALQEVLEKNGIKDTEVFYNGIDVSEWNVSPDIVEQFRRTHNLVGKKVILFGGRLSGLKGAYKAIEYLHQVRHTVPEAVLLVMGKKDAVAESVFAKAAELGLSGEVLFTGWVSGIDRICAYKVSDVVITPSLYLDPFPTINLEAMAAGVAVVTTCLGGSKEAVEDGIGGFVCNPFDVNDFTQKIVSLLKEPQVYTLSIPETRSRKHSFSLEKQSVQLLAQYQNLI